MKIIIPMAGTGQRFLAEGYQKAKPLILVNGQPMVEHAVSMFPGDHDFIFICNREHLENTEMSRVLKRIRPEAKIVSIEPHKKGPVYSLSLILNEIEDNEEVMISYCDYYMDWDFVDFIKQIRTNDWEAAVPCFTGFHPDLLKKKLYAGVLVDQHQGLLDIKEKHSFTEDPQDSHHSTGAFYFKKGSDLKNYTSELLSKPPEVNGEYYISMIYYLSKRDKRQVYVPEVNKVIILGTPEDLEEFEAWSRHFAERYNWRKKPTDIPNHRLGEVKIKQIRDSEEFNLIEKYWEDYFKKVKENNDD